MIGITALFGLVATFAVLPAFLPIGHPRIYGPRRDV